MSIPGHDKPLSASHCALCAQYWTDARYRGFIDDPRTVPSRPAAAAPAPPPCKFRGEQVFTSELSRAGLNPSQLHFHCGLGLGIAGIVCACRECTPRCGGYVAGAQAEEE